VSAQNEVTVTKTRRDSGAFPLFKSNQIAELRIELPSTVPGGFCKERFRGLKPLLQHWIGIYRCACTHQRAGGGIGRANSHIPEGDVYAKLVANRQRNGECFLTGSATRVPDLQAMRTRFPMKLHDVFQENIA